MKKEIVLFSPEYSKTIYRFFLIISVYKSILVVARVYLDIFQRITMIHVEKFQEKSVFLFFEL